MKLGEVPVDDSAADAVMCALHDAEHSGLDELAHNGHHGFLNCEVCKNNVRNQTPHRSLASQDQVSQCLPRQGRNVEYEPDIL